MYFWRIQDLKLRLQAQPLNEREALPYLLVFLLSTTAVALLPVEAMNKWYYVEAAATLVVTLAGTLFTYRCNGGAYGNHFLQRYFAIGWVISIRWASVIIPSYVFLITIFWESESITWQSAIYWIVTGALYYQRVGHHMRDVANATLLLKPKKQSGSDSN